MCAAAPNPYSPSLSASPHIRSDRYPIRPAHSSGAACSSGKLSGIGKQKRSSATVYSAIPPSMSRPVKRAFGHRFSRPLRQYRHSPQVHPSHGTPTRRSSPTTVAMIWWPRTRGGESIETSPSSRCRSVRQMPQACTFSSSCPGDASGSGSSTAASGEPTDSNTIARIRC
jgi:hypothetical protein